MVVDQLAKGRALLSDRGEHHAMLILLPVNNDAEADKVGARGCFQQVEHQTPLDTELGGDLYELEGVLERDQGLGE